jgi:hypothetical protein
LGWNGGARGLRVAVEREAHLMPSHPPDTTFYEDGANSTLWRDISRLYEDFLGDDKSQWPERQKRFKIVLGDVDSRLAVVFVVQDESL